MTFAIVLIGWIFSLCLHEFSHAFVAYLGGDLSVKDKGYLTFNPLKYTHPVLSIIMPVVFVMMGGIGLPGGAVYINNSRLRSPQWQSAVSLAGPVSNSLLALALGAAMKLAPNAFGGTFPAFAFLAQLQVAAVILNLLPIPPLDGYGIIAPFLPASLRALMSRVAGIFLILLFAILWNSPTANGYYWDTVRNIGSKIGVDDYAAWAGYKQFTSWRGSK